jgi:hypothetical protein
MGEVIIHFACQILNCDGADDQADCDRAAEHWFLDADRELHIWQRHGDPKVIPDAIGYVGDNGIFSGDQYEIASLIESAFDNPEYQGVSGGGYAPCLVERGFSSPIGKNQRRQTTSRIAVFYMYDGEVWTAYPCIEINFTGVGVYCEDRRTGARG